MRRALLLCAVLLAGLGGARGSEASAAGEHPLPRAAPRAALPTPLQASASSEPSPAEPLQALYRPEFRAVPVLLEALGRYGLEGAVVEAMGPWITEIQAEKPVRVATRLLLRGSRPQIDRLREVLGKLDVPSPAVAVAITVAEVRRSLDRETGGFLRFDRDGVAGAPDTLFRGTQGTFEPESWLRSQLTGVMPFQGTSLNLGHLGAGEGVFEHVLRALSQRDEADILARTTLVASEGRPAQLQSLVRVPALLFSSIDRKAQGATSVEVVTRAVDAGLTLDLVPLKVSQDGAILDLIVHFATAEPSNEPDAHPGDLVLRSRRLETRLTARDGESLVVGGLTLTRNLGDRRGMPLLNQVPALDMLVSADGRHRETTELIFVLTPRLLTSPQVETPTLAPAGAPDALPPSPRPPPAPPRPPGPFRGPYGSD